VYHYDHLGSITAITDFGTSSLSADTDGKPGRYSEDAWGQRRNPFTWSGAPLTTGANQSDDGSFDSLTPRGFTGHEMLDDLGLVHMNGRIYDPLLGRFLSADTVVQFPGSLQSYNRYSYVENNPLTRIDPTGWYSVLGLEFTDGGGVSGFFKDLGGYTVDAGSGAGQGAWNATIGGAISAGNEAGQMYIDSRESGSSGLASFGYASSMGLGRMSGGMGLVEFYKGERIETGADGSLKQGEFGSVTEWAVHGAASYVQAGTTAVGIKSFAARVGEMAPKTGPAPEIPAATAQAARQSTAQAAKELGSSLEAAGKVRPSGGQAAHIVPTSAWAKAKISDAAKAGIKIAQNKFDKFLGAGARNSSINGFWAKAGHDGTHTNKFFEALGKAFSDVDSKESAEAALEAVRKRIEAGDFLKKK
jgi:RHS repeat-associated protein